jgi:hypothetical protein
MSEVSPSPPASPADRSQLIRKACEIAAALVIIGLRLVLYPGDEKWKGPADWVLWVAAFWIFTVLAGHTRAWPVVTVLLVLSLGAIYLEGNLPIVVETLNWSLWP